MCRHITALALKGILMAALLSGAAGHAASFPFNGSFELIVAGKPLGWTVEGAWFVRPDAAAEGRNGITVFGDYGRQGAQLSTSGYLLAKDEPLTLSLVYSSPTGNVSCGLEFCDSLGCPIATGAWEALPVAEARRRYEREIVLPKTIEIPAPPPPAEPATPVEAAPADQPAAPAADQPAPAVDPPAAPAADQPAPAVDQPAAPAADQPAPTVDQPADAPAAAPAGDQPAPPADQPAATEPPPPAPTTVEVSYDSVRLVFRIEADGAQIKFDNVKLTHEGQLSPLPLPPKIKAELRPNLLPNGGFALGGECDPRGWAAVSDTHHAPELATALPQSNFLSLQATDSRGAAWLADPILLDGALPYSLQANLSATELQDSRMRVIIALVDPQDDRAVWLQEKYDVAAGENGVATLLLPRLWTDAGPVNARVGFEVLPGGTGEAQVRSAALCPEPLSLAVRSAAVAGGFKRPTDVSLFVSAINNTYAALKPKAILQVQDADGKPVASETRAIVIGPRSAAYFPYKPKLTGSGAYSLTVRIVNSGVELGSTTYEFRVGEATPASP